MGDSSLRPFICVGMAYFLIAVLVPLGVLNTQGESGRWTISGAFWALTAGVVGAVGALGVIMAFKFRGSPVYVMPLVFGCAPVVNTFVTMLMARTYKEARPIFYGGVIIVALGAAGVMYFKPSSVNISVTENDGQITVIKKNTTDGSETKWVAASLDELQTDPKKNVAYKLYLRFKGPSPQQFLLVLASIATTALCWGSYGPVLHRGQSRMEGSRMRPFLCVGLAYFAIAVIAPLAILSAYDEPGEWFQHDSAWGIFWSLGAGGAGAVGALGIILAFNFGGKPIFVMPLVFGCAPVVNTFTTMLVQDTFGQMQTPFIAALGLVIFGAVTVLLTAPKSGPKPAAKGAEKPAKTNDAAGDRDAGGKSSDGE
jgi:hypothetical protein